jgi:hypothetical protein
MASSGTLRRVSLVRTDVSEEPSASFIRVTRIGELGTMLVTASVVPCSLILVTLMKETLRSPKRRFLQEPHGVTFQKTPFFMVTAVNASNLTLVPLVSQKCHIKLVSAVGLHTMRKSIQNRKQVCTLVLFISA